MVSETKDPTKSRAGKLGAEAKWGGKPRVLRIGDLSPEQQRLVRALVAAARGPEAA